MERLNKYLAQAGVASRRQADQLIGAGRVEVNGEIITALGVQVDPDRDHVSVDGHSVIVTPQFEYWIVHKPPGYLTTVKDPFGRPTVMSLLPECSSRLYPVGRLDLDTSGLLFFTNDGQMALALTHPRHLVEKTYLASVLGIPASEDLDRLARGIVLEDGPTAPAKLALEKVENGNAIIRVILREGRKRQVKRMLKAIGHPVVALHRQAMGPLYLGELKPGEYRKPTPRELEELMALKRQVGKHS